MNKNNKVLIHSSTNLYFKESIMFDFISNFTTSVNVPALSLFLVLVCVHYLTIPFWIKALGSNIK